MNWTTRRKLPMERPVACIQGGQRLIIRGHVEHFTGNYRRGRDGLPRREGPARCPRVQLKRCQSAALRSYIDEVMGHSCRGHNGAIGTVLPPGTWQRWWRTGNAPDEERRVHPAPVVRPSPAQRACIKSTEPAILAAKEHQALSNGRGGTDGQWCAVVPARYSRAAIDKVQGTIVRTHIDKIIQQRWRRMQPSFRTGAPTLNAIDGVESIHIAIRRADIENALVHQRRGIDGVARLEAPTNGPIDDSNGQQPAITQANVEQIPRQSR